MVVVSIGSVGVVVGESVVPVVVSVCESRAGVAVAHAVSIASNKRSRRFIVGKVTQRGFPGAKGDRAPATLRVVGLIR